MRVYIWIPLVVLKATVHRGLSDLVRKNQAKTLNAWDIAILLSMLPTIFGITPCGHASAHTTGNHGTV